MAKGTIRLTPKYEFNQCQIRNIVEDIDEGKLSTSLSIQRDYRWNTIHKEKYIHSLLDNLIPTTITVIVIDGQQYICDAKQRCMTIVEFMNGGLYINKNHHYIIHYNRLINKIWTNEELDIAGMHYKDLPIELQNALRMLNLRMDIYKDLTVPESIEVFKRLNDGVSLSTGEKLRAPLFSIDEGETLSKIDNITDKKFKSIIEKIMTKDHISKSIDLIEILKAILLIKGETNSISSSSIERFIPNLNDNDIDIIYTALDKVLSNIDYLEKNPSEIDKLCCYFIYGAYYSKNIINYLRNVNNFFNVNNKKYREEVYSTFPSNNSTGGDNLKLRKELFDSFIK